MNDKYAAQKKHLSTKKQLRVWLSTEKYERFKKAVELNDTSIYAVINNFVDEYIKSHPGEV